MFHYLTVQPLGIPLAPVVQLDIEAALVKVPAPIPVGTPESHLFVQFHADMSVARQVTLFRLLQP